MSPIFTFFFAGSILHSGKPLWWTFFLLCPVNRQKLTKGQLFDKICIIVFTARVFIVFYSFFIIYSHNSALEGSIYVSPLTRHSTALRSLMALSSPHPNKAISIISSSLPNVSWCHPYLLWCRLFRRFAWLLPPWPYPFAGLTILFGVCRYPYYSCILPFQCSDQLFEIMPIPR